MGIFPITTQKYVGCAGLLSGVWGDVGECGAGLGFSCCFIASKPIVVSSDWVSDAGMDLGEILCVSEVLVNGVL